MEDRRKSGEATLDLFDIDDVGLVDAGLGPSGGHIVDLDGQSRPGLGVEGGETGEQCRVLEGTQQFDAGDGLLELECQLGAALPELTAELLGCLLTFDDVGKRGAVVVETAGNVSD